MSILIKGIEMPKECKGCPIYNSEYLHCNITTTEPWQGHEDDDVVPIPLDCPLIELPPHGRLIDADALIEEWDNGLMDDAPTIIEAEGDDDSN